MLSRQFGGLWGTLIGMAIYFVALYCGFMLVTHFFFVTVSWILSHKLISMLLLLAFAYIYLVAVRGEPWYLSQGTRDTVNYYSLHAAVVLLQKLALVSHLQPCNAVVAHVSATATASTASLPQPAPLLPLLVLPLPLRISQRMDA